MKQDIRALLNLQEIDTELDAAKKSLAALDGGAALKQGLAQTETILAKRTALLHTSESELKEKELKLKSLETKRQDFDNRLYAGKVTNPKELSSIQQEIAMINRNREKLDERILELYDLIEQQKKPVQEAEERREQFKTKLEQVLTQQESKRKALTAEITRLSADRQEVTAKVPEQLLKRYNSKRTQAGGVGISLTEGGRCGACKTSITAYVSKAWNEDKDYPLCESCGRFLCLDGV